MAYLVIDTETTTSNKGNSFDPRNRLCLVSWKTENKDGVYKIEYDAEPYGSNLVALQYLINIHDTLILFNAKFDLHWLREYGIQFQEKKIFDVQLAHFILSRQTEALPSLNQVATHWGLEGKLEDIKEYWDAGIDTPNIPLNLLCSYALQDVSITERCYLKQVEKFKQAPKLKKLHTLACQDLLVLAEMEWNGMLYDVDASLKEADTLLSQMNQIEHDLNEEVGDVEIEINWQSPKQVSAVLYGGTILTPSKESYTFTYKDGRTAEKLRAINKLSTFPKLIDPPKKAKTASKETWSVAEPIIKNLKATGKAKRIINLLLQLSKLEKLHGTYLAGIPAIMDKFQWKDYIHGQLNQTIAKTGRLSSSNPNMQNMPSDVDKFFVSRFDDGIVVQFDVKGLEVLCAAFLSQDAVLLKELRDGEDVHANNQEAFHLVDRLAAKRFMFKMIYGGTAKGFANDSDFISLKMSVEQWQKVIDAFYAKYKGIANWHRQLIASILRTTKYQIPSGREFDFSVVMEQPDWYFIPKFKNYPVQGFGADIVMMARISLFRRLLLSKMSAKLVNTIHDSIILDIERKDWYNINMMVKKVFKDLPTNMKNIWEIDLGLEVNVEASILTTGEDIK